MSCFLTDRTGNQVFDNDGLYLETIDSDYSLYDMVMGENYQLYGITNDNMIIQLNLSEYVKEL